MASTAATSTVAAASMFDEIFTFKSFVHACSGATGGITAISVFYPLNLVRTRLQVSNDKKLKSMFGTITHILKTEGFRALFQGWWSQIVSLGTSNFVYFYTYNMLKAVFKRMMINRGMSPEIGPLMNLLIASISGIFNVLMTTPLWVVGTRLTVQAKQKEKKEDDAVEQDKKPYTGVYDALTRIANEEGVQALWNGVGPSLVLVSNPTIHFVTYENVRKFFSARAAARGSPITSLEFFFMGALAKAVATVVTYPLQIAQSRLRASRMATESESKKQSEEQGSNKQSKETYSGTIDCLRKLYLANGFPGWYRGMEAKLWQTVLTAAFQFLTYETIAATVFKLMLGADAAAAAPKGGH